MSQYTAYANYVIYFSDPTEYAAALALCGGNGFGHCPYTAASTFGIPWPLPGGGALAAKGMYGYLPYGIPSVPGPGIEVNHPNASGVYLKSDVDSVIVPGQDSNPPSGIGPDLNLVWWGQILQVNNTLPSEVPPTTPIPQRRWITGFEQSGALYEGDTNAVAASGGSRVSSRTLDGLGYILRGKSYQYNLTKVVANYRPGLAPKTSWERFYIKINALGSNELIIWYATGYNPSNEGATLRVDTSGHLLIYNAYSMTTGPLMGTSSFALTLNKWYLIDLLLTWPTIAADVGRVRLYINHTLDVNATVNTGVGMDRLTYHQTSSLGQMSTAEDYWEVDLDDWIGSDVPNNSGVESLDSIDWLVGSHVRTVNIDSGALVNYTGHISMCNQYITPNTVQSSQFVSATALATIEGLTDAVDAPSSPGLILGPVAAFIAGYLIVGVNSTGRIGYKIAGGAYVYINTTETTGYYWVGNLYSQSGQPLPVSITPFSIIKEKSNDTHTSNITALSAVVEYIGAWGKEDNPLFPIDLSNNINLILHNSRYANTQFALGPVGGAPTAPCFAIGGTYVGNGTAQTFDLSAPAHFIWIRPLTGSTSGGVKWFGASLDGHEGAKTRTTVNAITRCWVDSTGQAKVTITGEWAENNKAGITYQYIVFCDPGMRFEYCGAYNINNFLTTTVLPLFDTAWLAEAGFIQKDLLQSDDTTNTLNYKGPGHTGITGSLITGVPVTKWGSFAAGALTVDDDNINSLRNQYNYSLWRTIDPNSGYIQVQIFSYTGDGLTFRTINFPYTTGRYPLIAVVIPHDSNKSFMRDPSHTGNDSCAVQDLGNLTTAIVGASAPDQMNIGVTLNANGIVYDVFIILGDSTGWNNGTFYPSSGVASGPWTQSPYSPPDKPIITMDGGINFNGSMSLLAIEDISGIYTLVPDKLTDTVYDGLSGGTHLEVAIPEPFFKTGYIGG